MSGGTRSQDLLASADRLLEGRTADAVVEGRGEGLEAFSSSDAPQIVLHLGDLAFLHSDNLFS